MIYKFVALLVFSAVLLAQVLSVPCNCGLGRGVNVCSEQGDSNIDTDNPQNGKYPSYPLVVRPQTLSKVDINEMVKPGTPMYDKILSGESNIGPLKPIGDICSCGRTIVTPAHVPKPACSGCGGSSSGSTSILEQAATSTLEQALEGTSSSSSNAQSSFSPEQLGGIIVDVPVCGLPVIQPSRPVYYGSQVPADAVSKALAYQQLQSKQYALDHELQYGFKTMPKESIRYNQHQRPIFHEDNIYRLNGDVLELGKILNAPSVDEVAIAELEEEEEPEIEIEPVKVQEITLGSLGFVPTYGPKTRFTNVEVPQPHIAEYHTSSCGIDAVPTCNDGFRGGQVIIKEEPIRSEILPQKPVVGYVSEDGGPKYISDSLYSYSSNPRGVVGGFSSDSSSSFSSSSTSSSTSDIRASNSYFSRGSCS